MSRKALTPTNVPSSATDINIPSPITGDMYFNTSTGLMIYDGTVWTGVGGSSSGDITAVNAGTGLSGGGTTGSVTLSIDSTVATLNGFQTLTNKTFNLADNTFTATSAQLATAVSDETGTGSLVFATSPTLVTPDIGVATGTSFNSITGLSSTNPQALGSVAIGTATTTARADHVHPTTGLVTTVNGSSGAITNVALTTGTLAQFAATTSAQLAGVISDETGSGALVFATSPSLTTPSLGVATGTSFNSITGLATTNPTALGAVAVGTATTTARADHVHPTTGLGVTSGTLAQFAATTSAQLAGVISDETGSGALVFATSPTLTTPNIGVASGTSFNSITGLSSTTPAADSGAGAVGTGTTVARADHVHPASSPPGANWALISSSLLNSQGTINFTGLSTRKKYAIGVSNARPTTTNAIISILINNDASAIYHQLGVGTSVTTTSGFTGYGSTSLRMGVAGTLGTVTGWTIIDDCDSTSGAKSFITLTGPSSGSTSSTTVQVQGFIATNSVVSQINVVLSAGIYDLGTIYLWGSTY